ncbi:phage head morphogenesis protein [Enterococcus italicus]|uniref:phage head morphogenesis protein n=1 Tax=Enterococcus italicus TaxID=246144 RepID=UPI0028AE94D1|nr:phage minor head protein [Enterococcus italicus]
MSKYQKEIEILLSKSESNVNKELQALYKELANEVTKEIVSLADQIEKDDKFSKKLQKERLETIRSQMYAKANQLEGNQKQSLFEFLKHDAGTSYNELFYEFEMTERIPVTFAMITDRQIATIINTPVAGRKLSARLKGNSTKMKQNLNRVLTRGFAKGWSTQKMATQIAEIGGANYRRAMTIARTESGRVTSVTRQQSQQHAKELGIKAKKKWISTLDGDTRNTHRQLDGQVQEVDDYFKIGGMKALQPHMFGIAREDCNCRCRTINVLDGYEAKLRRNNDTGEVEEYKNYQEWLKDKTGGESGEDSANLKNLYNDAKGDRKVFAEKILDSIGINVPVEIKTIKAFGYNQFENFGKGQTANVSSFVLNKNDDRSSRYQAKTVLHETYHSRMQGLEVPISRSGKFTIKEWTAIEETMTETAAHYQMSFIDKEKLMPSYSNYLSVNLPRLQKIEGFEEATDFLDFGKIAMKYRFDDKYKTADWRDLHEKINAVEFDFNKYVRDNYVEELKSKKAAVLDMIYANSTSFKQHDEYIQKDYDNFIEKVASGNSYFSKNEEMIGGQAVTALYRLVGVKKWK